MNGKTVVNRCLWIAVLIVSTLVLQPLRAVAACEPASFLPSADEHPAPDWQQTQPAIWWVSVGGEAIQPVDWRSFAGPHGATVLMMVVTAEAGLRNVQGALDATQEMVEYLGDRIDSSPARLDPTLEIDGPCEETRFFAVQVDTFGLRSEIRTCLLATPPYSTLIVVTRGYQSSGSATSESLRILDKMVMSGVSAGCSVRSPDQN